MGSSSSKERVNKGKAPAQPQQSRCSEGLGDLTRMHNCATALMKQGKLQDACSMYRTALDVSERVLGEAHQVTLGIRHDLQEMQKQNNLYEMRKQRTDTLELRQALAAKHGLPIPADPFTTTRSVTMSQVLDMCGPVVVTTTAGPEVANATALRLAETTRHPLSAPVIIPPHYTTEAESRAVSGPGIYLSQYKIRKSVH